MTQMTQTNTAFRGDEAARAIRATEKNVKAPVGGLEESKVPESFEILGKHSTMAPSSSINTTSKIDLHATPRISRNGAQNKNNTDNKLLHRLEQISQSNKLRAIEQSSSSEDDEEPFSSRVATSNPLPEQTPESNHVLSHLSTPANKIFPEVPSPRNPQQVPDEEEDEDIIKGKAVVEDVQERVNDRDSIHRIHSGKTSRVHSAYVTSFSGEAVTNNLISRQSASRLQVDSTTAKVLWQDDLNTANISMVTPREVVSSHNYGYYGSAEGDASQAVCIERQATEDSYEDHVQTSVEEVEPVIDQVRIDAACLTDYAVVRLQQYQIHNYVQQKRGDEESTAMPVSVTIRAVNWGSTVLCYGDRVQLFSTSATGVQRWVGVERATNQVRLFDVADNMDPTKDDVAHWDIFRGDSSCHLIRVGHAVLEHREEQRKHAPAPRRTGPVRTGHPVLLRHAATGGLLSFVANEWCVLTSSYQQQEEPVADDLLPPNIGKISLNRLRDQDLIVPSSQEIFTFAFTSVPWTTAWLHGGPKAIRKFLSKTYLRFADRHEIFSTNCNLEVTDTTDFRSIAQISHQEQQTMLGQEQILVEELLGSYVGLEGTFLRTRVDGYNSSDTSMRGQRIRYHVEQSSDFDRGLLTLVDDLLTLSDSFILIEEFVATRLFRFEYGSVMQALCYCLDLMMQEHASLVSGIEDTYRRKGGMSLHELQVLSQPLSNTMAVISQVVFAAAEKKGGALINSLRLLLVRKYHGNTGAEEILERLLNEASKPFMTMLAKWLTSGVLDDPYREFMIQYHEEAGWEGRYTLDQENTLELFFPTAIEEYRVLATGKYWDAIRTCLEITSFHHVQSPIAASQNTSLELEYRANGAQVAAHIQKLYTTASQSLVRILMEECDLVGTLKLMKRYFLLDQGDFFLNFLDAAEDELSRVPSKLRQFRVQHLLHLSVQLLENSNDLSKEKASCLRLTHSDVTCRFAGDSLVDQLTNGASLTSQRIYSTGQDTLRTGVDLFLLEFSKIPFPLSLVLSEPSLATYRVLFRHLFFAKHVERKLVIVWQDHLATKEFASVRGALGSTYALRQRMLHCVQNLIYFMTFEVIEPNWLQMMSKMTDLATTQTVDEVIGIHNMFLDETLKACLLTESDYVIAFTRVMQTCLLFSKQMETFIMKVRLHQDRHRLAIENQNRVRRSLHARESGLAKESSINRIHEDEKNAKEERIKEQIRRLEREVTGPEYIRMISQYEASFTKHLRAFMKIVTTSDDRYHVQKMNLCVRLDFNGFFSGSMGLG